MDRITGFSDDELLVKILSFLPTKFAITTSVLSKQWKFLWMRLPKLEYDELSMYSSEEGDSVTSSIESERSQKMRCFIDKNLPLHSSPVVKSLKLTFYNEIFQPAIKGWVEIAISRCVEELSVEVVNGKLNAVVPSSLYICKSLVTLKLNSDIFVDVPHVCSLPSLKTLHLRHVIYAHEESLQRLLSNSSVLEDLVIELCSYDNYFRVKENFSKSSFDLIKNMPKLEEADITAGHSIKKLLELFTSVKRLSLTIMHDNGAEALTAVYGEDIVFNELEHLKFHIHYSYWSKVLHWLLIASPKLRNLDFHEHLSRDGMDTLVCWKQLNSVPQCLLSSLQTFKWTCYQISVECKDLVQYILRKSCQLKTATIVFGRGLDPKKKFETETEVKFCFRASPIVILSTAEESRESRLLTALNCVY